MTKKYHYQYNQQGITPDKKGGNHRTPTNKKYPYPSIISHFVEKVNSKMNKPLEPGLKMPKNYEIKAIKLTSLALTTFLVTLFATSILAPVQPSQAAEVLMGLQTTNSTISLTTSGNINLSMTAGSAGAVRTVQDTVTVTAGDSGYQLYVGTANSTNALIRDGATSTGTDTATGLPTYASSDLIPASLITNISEPDVLSNDTWGFAVAQPNSTSGSGSEDVVENGFDSSYPTGDNSSASSKFIAVPAHGNDVLIAERSTSADAVPTNVYYGARATSAKPSGLYKNTIVYTAIGNGSTTGLASVSPSRTNQISGGETLTITTPSTLDLSSIAGTSVTIGGEECTSPTAEKASDNISVNITCTSPALATGWHEVIAVITTTAGSTETYTVSPGIEYYAEPVTLYSLANGKTMQELTTAMCEAAAVDTAASNIAVLTDSRDGNTYRVAKLADGNCWMVQNLRLGADPYSLTTAKAFSLTSSDSDVSSSFSVATSNIASSGTTSWSGTYDVKHIYLTGNEEYGNFYNWYTATAGTGTQNGVTSGDDASASICPASGTSGKPWKLPPNTGNGSYTTMFQSSGVVASGTTTATDTTVTNKMKVAPYSFPLSGFYSDGAKFQGGYGYFWSRTAASYNVYAYHFRFSGSGYFVLQDYSYKYNGASVRCVLTPPTAEQANAITAIKNDTTTGTLDLSNIITMQQFSSDVCSAMKLSTTSSNASKKYKIKDSRDQKTYNVAKLDDGLCWMVSNLRLGDTNTAITLTYSDSDVSSDTTIPASAIVNSGDTNWSGTVDAWHAYVDSNTTYGNHYNWYTATASTGTSSMKSTSATNTNDATSSICPKGWKLPRGGDTGTGSFQGLATAASIANSSAGSTKIRSAPYSFPYAGYYYVGLNTQGINGSYWSRSAYTSEVNAYILSFNSSNVVLQYGDNKYSGNSVRCIFTGS